MKPRDQVFAPLNEERPDAATDSTARALPAGAVIGEFEVEEVIDEGGATIVYAAMNRSLGVPAAIAEYMPAWIAQRNAAMQVTPRMSADNDVFALGLQAFIDETHTLARCDHPSLVRVVGQLEANATAYRVMPRYRGERLLVVRQRMAEPPDERAVRGLIDALLGALETFHRTDGFHGNVTPTNILLLADNQPVLLSPGLAGRAIAGDRIDFLMTSQEPSFAPVEQILESADMPIHPSVDLYALAGVARYWITGQMPGPALGTHDTESREPLAEIIERLRLTRPRLHYSASLLDALESALSIYPAKRPQTVAQMRARLGPAPTVVDDVISSPSTAFATNDAVSPWPERPGATRDLGEVTALTPNRDPLASDRVARIDVDPSARTAFAHQAPKSRPMARWSAIVVLLLALMPIGLYRFQETPVAPPTPDNRGVGAADSSPASAADSTAPVTPPIAADVETIKSPSTGDVADSSASARESTSIASTNPSSADTGTSAESAAVKQSPARAATPSRVVQREAPRIPASPRAACGSRTKFSLYRCMQTQCSQRQWTSHPQCERLRATDSVD